MIKNGQICSTDYIRFGSGSKHLVILPGLGDGLRTAKGTALPMALLYHRFAREYTVYAFSRRNDISVGATTRDMAADVKHVMDELGISRADVLGVSMGGMIAQWLAVDHPAAVGKLILTVTCPEPNPILEESVQEWAELARAGDHTALMDSNLVRIYSDAYCRQYRPFIPLVGHLTKPKSYDRFLVLAEACLKHNAAAELHRITAPTLVIGGEKDRALGAEPSRQLAAAIPGAQLRMYEQWGHGLYDEAKDFQFVVLDFLRKDDER